MSHQQVTLNLLQCIQNYANHNQQRGTAVELSELVVDMTNDCEHWKDSDNSQED